ncbi:MAG: hypothetical protein A3F74_19225 [Betaproteobacteria bacterium RIFCSPLOWO2_12_FULL_62_58]|nr:MAG: hypothetical protein A3F74_19225 [Betaproteobacteria bacterium RIFCSPLOWO2_12_FULL_62_58]
MPAARLLDYLCNPAWFGGQEARQIFVRYYVPVLVGPDHLRLANTFEQYEIGGIPVRLVIAQISDQIYISNHPAWTSTADGNTALIGEAIQRKLPDSLYVLLSTPLAPIQDWNTAARNMDKLASVLRYAFGMNFVFHIAREAIVDIPGGNMTTPSRLIPAPQPSDGPSLGREHRELLQELLAALAGKSGELADRVLFSLELFERAAQQLSGAKFFYYWIGIEVLCGSYGMQSILSRLEKAYGTKRAYVQNDLGFTQVWRMRTELFHHGQQHDMPQDVERYVQAMFMDLVRFHLDLPCRRHMEMSIRQGFQIERLKREVGTTNVLSIDARPAAHTVPESPGQDPTDAG